MGLVSNVRTQPPMTVTERFATAAIEPPQRVDYWNRVGTETYSALTVEPQFRSTLDAVLFRRAYGANSLSRVETSPATVRGAFWAQSRRDPEHAFVVLQERGATDYEQDGKKVRLGVGDLTLQVAPRPFSLTFSETVQLLILKLPYARLEARIGDPARHVMTHIPARKGALLAGFLRTLAGQEDAPEDAAWTEAVCDAMFDMVALTYRQRAATREPRTSLGERWQHTVRAFVDRHLADPELGATLIARQLGVTPRYVQMVFAGMATTASAYILARRLELAAELLAVPQQSVADVAFRVGFSDLSYFHRCFRKRFGTSPGRHRKS